MQASIGITDNSESIKDAKAEVVAKILEMWGQYAEGAAKDNITAESRVDTGNLRNSISHQVEVSEESVYIGTNVAYAVYNEVGTGIFYPGGRQTPWRYKDPKDDNRWITTRGMEGIHFLEHAISEHVDEYNAMAEQELKAGS